MALAPSSDYFAPTAAVFAFSNNTVEGTPASGAPELLVAAGAGDNTEITGNTINRETYGMPTCGVLAISSYVNLADTETLSLGVDIQESSDGSTWDTAEVLFADAVVKTASGAFTDGFAKTFLVNLRDRKQYIRFNVTPNFSASSTDTGVVQGVFLMAGSPITTDLTGAAAHTAEDTI